MEAKVVFVPSAKVKVGGLVNEMVIGDVQVQFVVDDAGELLPPLSESRAPRCRQGDLRKGVSMACSTSATMASPWSLSWLMRTLSKSAMKGFRSAAPVWGR
ncbi:hypothetical protein [Streptomyces pseudogriseolus]|uniref:hypothetical protein n=1 Tax=Streptomyces pseudogriseolus TaxID=36817 RepID=UPI003FA1DDED